MTYEETLQLMFNQLPMFQRVGKAAFKKTLDNILAFCGFLGNPHQKFKSIHVTGTNGKGSSSAMLAAILQAADYKVGLYTSPHLKHLTERVRINGQEISQQDVIDFIERSRSLIEEIQPSFFEMTVAMAFDHFARQQVDYAVIEVGLGGRLDSTNIISPEICLITNISMDHASMLGNTLTEIANVKAGIIKKSTPVVISEYQEEVSEVFIHEAQQQEATISFASQHFYWKDQAIYSNNDQCMFPSLLPYLQGKHQQANVLGVIATALQLEIPLDHIQQGIEKLQQYVPLKGRWQQLGIAPRIFCDVGHNEAGVAAILAQLQKLDYEQLHIVWGMVNDKEVSKILKMLPKEAKYYFCQPNVPRGMEVSELVGLASQSGLIGHKHNSVQQAIETAKKNASPHDMIFIGGSTFVVAEIEEL